MAFPLIILENHFLSSARSFVAQNAKTLKQLGYKKLLIEMDKTLSPEQFKKQLRSIINNPLIKNMPNFRSHEAFYTMILAIEEAGIEYEFIDPETQAEALKQINNMKEDAQSSKGSHRAVQHRIETTKKRDEIMTPIIINQTKKYNGGVIYLGGFMHHWMIHLLESNQRNYYKYAIFSNDQELKMIKDSISNTDYTEWSQLSVSDIRLQIYKTNIHYFNMTKPISFELIESSCGLTSEKTSNTPVVSEKFIDDLQLPFSFFIDEHHVAKAKVIFNSDQIKENSQKVSKAYPNLFFFIHKEGNKASLTIPGTNLTEQKQCL